MTKRLFIFFMLIGYNLLFFVQNIQASNNPDDKIFSQQEFDKKLEEEIVRRLAKVTGESLEGFAKSLLAKEKELDSKADDLNKREKELSIIEKGLQSKIKSFRDEQDKVIGCVRDNEKDASKRIDHIVKVISGMKPVNAAEVLTVQDSGISVQIISKLNPEKVSKIFNLMDKEISARLQKSYINMKK